MGSWEQKPNSKGLKSPLRGLFWASLLSASMAYGQGNEKKEYKSLREYGSLIQSLPKFDTVSHKIVQDGGWSVILDKIPEQDSTKENSEFHPEIIFTIPGMNNAFGIMIKKLHHTPTEEDSVERDITSQDMVEQIHSEADSTRKEWRHVFPTYRLNEPLNISFDTKDISYNGEALLVNFFDASVGKERVATLIRKAEGKDFEWIILDINDVAR